MGKRHVLLAIAVMGLSMGAACADNDSAAENAADKIGDAADAAADKIDDAADEVGDAADKVGDKVEETF